MRLAEKTRSKQFVIAYDNFNFKDTLRDQAIGSSRSVMRNLSTAILVHTKNMPPGGLFQRQLHLERPLNFLDVVESPACGLQFDHVARAMARHFVAVAIQYLHRSAVQRVFGDDGFETRFAMPTLDVLEPRKTPVHLLCTVFENEATLRGSARVHEELYLQQLKLGSPDATSAADIGAKSANSSKDNETYLDKAPEFLEHLFLAYGDQMTTARIRGVKYGKRYARRAFDRRDWLLGPPVWFHTLQSLLHLIARTHWEPIQAGQFSRATLVHDITYLDRHGISKDSIKYHQMQPLITQGFRARICALFYRTLRSRGLLDAAVLPTLTNSAWMSQEVYPRYFDTYDHAIRSLDKDEFDSCINNVCERALSRDAWIGKGVEDYEFVTMCRFLQEALLFLELQHAVKFGDIGLLRRFVDPLAISFGGNQHQYGFEMLHLRWLLHQSDPELQRAILACSLVNERGRPDTFKSIDLVLEHINLGFAQDIKKRKNSTHDVVNTFVRGSMSHDELRKVRAAFELNFGARTNTKHSYKRTEGDTFNLAVKLDGEGCTVPQVAVNREKQFLSRDIIGVGTEILPAKLLKFNTDVVRLPETECAARRLLMNRRDDSEEGRHIEEVDAMAAEVHDSTLDAITVADQECFLDADISVSLDRHLESIIDAREST